MGLTRLGVGGILWSWNPEDAGDQVIFSFGMLFPLYPVAALVASIVAVVVGIASVAEAGVTVALTLVLIAAMYAEIGWPYRLVVLPVVLIVRAVERVPGFGEAAQVAGSLFVFWHPVVVLAIVVALL
jgi:hypothetical protein